MASVSHETVKSVQQAVMTYAIAENALLSGFSALNAMHVPDARGNLPFLKVIALYAPLGVKVDDFVLKLNEHVSAEAFFQPGETFVSRPPFRSAFFSLAIHTTDWTKQARDVVTVAPFPALPFLPEGFELEAYTWALRVSVGSQKWSVRALLPSVFRQVLQYSNSGRVLAAFDANAAEGVLLLPPTDKEAAVAASWIAQAGPDTTPAAAFAPTSILRRTVTNAVDAETVGSAAPDAVIFPTAADMDSIDAPSDLPAALRVLSLDAWSAVEKLCAALIAYPTLPRLALTTPDVNLAALSELHVAAYVAHNAHAHIPGARPLDAYLYASNTLPHGRYGMWALLNVLFAVPTKA